LLSVAKGLCGHKRRQWVFCFFFGACPELAEGVKKEKK